MEANSATGSIAPSVQKLIINSDVGNQLRSEALRDRLLYTGLSHGSIELYLKCPNLTAIGWGKFQALNFCLSLIRVDLTGCPKLESIPRRTFTGCSHLVSVVFGEHSNITNLGERSFQNCVALTSITLPDKLEVIEELAFASRATLD